MKIIITLILTTFFLTSCEKISFGYQTVHGNGKVSVESRYAGEFRNIENRINANIYVVKGNHYNISVSSDANLLPMIRTLNVNGRLIISSGDYNLVSVNPITITLVIPEVDEICLSGSGMIESACPPQHLFLSGSGNISCSGESDNIQVVLTGSGNINLKKQTVRKADVAISGSGNITLNVEERLDVAISGSGNVYYMGDPSIDQYISGSGKVHRIY